MEKTHFTFDSLTGAQSAKKILQKQGIGAEIVKTSGVHSKKGCSYSVVTTRGALSAKILKGAGIKYNGVY